MKKGQIGFLNYILLIAAVFILAIGISPLIKAAVSDTIPTTTDTTQLFLLKSATAMLLAFIVLIGIKAIRDRQYLGG